MSQFSLPGFKSSPTQVRSHHVRLPPDTTATKFESQRGKSRLSDGVAGAVTEMRTRRVAAAGGSAAGPGAQILRICLTVSDTLPESVLPSSDLARVSRPHARPAADCSLPAVSTSLLSSYNITYITIRLKQTVFSREHICNLRPLGEC